jgi:hypothetical protein
MACRGTALLYFYHVLITFVCQKLMSEFYKLCFKGKNVNLRWMVFEWIRPLTCISHIHITKDFMEKITFVMQGSTVLKEFYGRTQDIYTHNKLSQ